MDLTEFLFDPLTYAFMQRGLLAVMLTGGITAIVGCYVVVRGMAFLGDAIAHSILPGVAVAFISGADLFLGGLIAGVGSALGIGWLTRGERLKEDTAIGVVFAGMFALGIALISSARSYAVDLTHILFGNVLGVDDTDLLIMVISGGIVLLIIALFYKELLVLSFDASLARTLKLPQEGLRLMLLALIAVTIVVSLQTVGIALMVAMLVTPAATAQLITRRLHHMMFTAALIGGGSGLIGLYASYYLNIASGAAVVLTATLIFIIVFSGVQLRDRLGERQITQEAGTVPAEN